MNPGHAHRQGHRKSIRPRRGSAGTAVLGAIVRLIDLAGSAFFWSLGAALLPDPATGWALGGFALVSLLVFVWPGPRRRERLLDFWCIPVDLLRGLAVGFRRWLARYPGLELLWRGRFYIGIVAMIQNALEGTLLFGLLLAGIIAASYLLPWLRRVHTRRVHAAATSAARPTREISALGVIRIRPDNTQPPARGTRR